MPRPEAIAAAIKSLPGRTQSSGWGRVSPLAAELMNGSNSYTNTYGPFLPRPSRDFTDGAFGPMSPIQPVPVDNPPPGGMFADPRLWPYRVGWNLPTQPGAEGLKLASFDQLYTLAQKYSVARQCIELRKDEILGLEWEIQLTTDAVKAYRDDNKAMRDFGERKAKATRFFNHPDPDYWSFHSFMEALLEEIFVYDALSLIFRPKYGAGLGRGLLGSDLDHIKLISGPTIRPLVDMHGAHPAPPSPAYQQYLYGVPRSDYITMMRGDDIDDYGLTGSEINTFRSDMMLYAPLKPTRESPYGFPPVERALLPIISGLQKQEFQLDYFTEGSVPAVYISPGDPNITPTQIRELQDALNAIAGDPAYHQKVIVLPPGSKVDPQRPVDLSDSFDELVMNQVCMAFDIQPTELGIIPSIGGGAQGPSASGIRFQAQAARDIKERKSTKPMLLFLCDIFNYVLQDICGQRDLQFAFEGLVDDEDKQAITELGVQQVQNGISSIDEVRERLDLAPWGLSETSEPVVFTAQGPIPFSMAPQLIAAMQAGAGGGSSSSGGKGQKTTSTRSRSKQPTIRQGGQTKPNGSHPSPAAPSRAGATPGHAAAAGAVQGATPTTGGTRHRSPVAGSRKKAIASELDALRRHLRKGREIGTWEARNIDDHVLGLIAEDIAKGVLIDTAIDRVLSSGDFKEEALEEPAVTAGVSAGYPQWPGWQEDLHLVSTYKGRILDAFHEADVKASQLRKDAATGTMMVTSATLRGLINDEMRDVFLDALTPLWTDAWHLGYTSAESLLGIAQAGGSVKSQEDLDNFLGTEGEHWLQQIQRTGIARSSARSEIIARTEVARAVNTAAIQCYKDHGVSYKHLLTAPDDTCDICKDAADDGVIPMDGSFSAGGVLGFCHPQCRCVPAPADIEVEPPLSNVGKSEDLTRASFIMFRARNKEGKWVYLLQKRGDDMNHPGTWGLPGGTAHEGEDARETAIREVTEEMGQFPPVEPTMIVGHQQKDRFATIYLCDVPLFHPSMDGSTMNETAGYGWFGEDEIDDLNLQPHFRKLWDAVDFSEMRKTAMTYKFLNVNENGEVSVQQDGGVAKPQPTGANWPIPHRVDGTQEPLPDSLEGTSADLEDWSNARNSLLYPVGDRDADYPPARGRGPGGPRDGSPQAGFADERSRSSNSPGTGVPKGAHPNHGGQAAPRGDMAPGQGGQSLSGGPVPAVTPHPYAPHAIPPTLMAPDGNECSVCGGPSDSPMHAIRPVKQ